VSRKLDKHSYWWRGIEDTWYVMKDNIWYRYKSGNKDSKKKPNSGLLISKINQLKKKLDRWYVLSIILGAVLGISLAFNIIWMLFLR
jgi:hypothetical protein